MKLSKNGLEIRDRIYDKIHEKYGIDFISTLMKDKKRVEMVLKTANQIDYIEQNFLNIIGSEHDSHSNTRQRTR